MGQFGSIGPTEFGLGLNFFFNFLKFENEF